MIIIGNRINNRRSLLQFPWIPSSISARTRYSRANFYTRPSDWKINRVQQATLHQLYRFYKSIR